MATHCHIWEQPFFDWEKRVIDHCHLMPGNNYRGTGHEYCNLSYKDTRTIPVVFHYLSGYDAHFIVTDIDSKMEGRLDLLPVTKEQYISFTKHINDYLIQFRLID